jgi:hypothetical protein
MKKVIFKIVFVVGILSFFRCSNSNTFEIVEGIWSIDTVLFKHQDVSNCLNLNIINLEKKTNCDFPEIWSSCKELGINDRNGRWLIVESGKGKLKIDISSNNFFKGSHKIIFIKDEINHLFKMQLESDNLYVVCRKGLLNFNDNIDNIDKLVRLSKK